MDANQYQDIVEKAFSAIETLLDESPVDLDYQNTGDGVIEIDFEDGGKIIISRHQAMQEIWVAASSGAFHFRWDGNHWRDTRSETELFAKIEQLLV